MRARNLTAVVAPLLFAIAPLAAQPKPATTQPKPATPAAAPGPASARAVAPAASKLRLEITGGAGTTIVSMDSWAGRPANDWGTVNYWGAGRLLFPLGQSAMLGVEAGYHYHFWYNYFPGGTSYPYQYDVTATHVAAMVRMTIAARTTLDLGGGLHMFNNAGTHPGALAALTYHIPLTESLDLPVGIRADAIFTNPTIIPLVVNVGLGIQL